MDAEIKLNSVLNRAQAGLDLAKRVLERIHAHGHCDVDFLLVDRMTPSFANAFVMTLLEAQSEESLRDCLVMSNRNAQVHQVMDESAVRFAKGVRLSIQQSVVA